MSKYRTADSRIEISVENWSRHYVMALYYCYWQMICSTSYYEVPNVGGEVCFAKKLRSVDPQNGGQNSCMEFLRAYSPHAQGSSAITPLVKKLVKSAILSHAFLSSHLEYFARQYMYRIRIRSPKTIMLREMHIHLLHEISLSA